MTLRNLLKSPWLGFVFVTLLSLHGRFLSLHPHCIISVLLFSGFRPSHINVWPASDCEQHVAPAAHFSTCNEPLWQMNMSKSDRILHWFGPVFTYLVLNFVTLKMLFTYYAHKNNLSHKMLSFIQLTTNICTDIIPETWIHLFNSFIDFGINCDVEFQFNHAPYLDKGYFLDMCLSSLGLVCPWSVIKTLTWMTTMWVFLCGGIKCPVIKSHYFHFRWVTSVSTFLIDKSAFVTSVWSTTATKVVKSWCFMLSSLIWHFFYSLLTYLFKSPLTVRQKGM